MSRELCLKVLQVVNCLSIISGIITIVAGTILIPQTVTNNGNIYIGTAEQYNTDLYKVQTGSNGFKIVMIGIGIFLYGLSGCFGVLYCYKKYGLDLEILSRRVRINPEPTIIEIPNNTQNLNERNQNNIRKWTGGLFSA
jgi:hypothetical protein